MVCSIDDIVSRRPGKHTRFPTVYSLFIHRIFFFFEISINDASPTLSLSFLFLSLSTPITISFLVNTELKRRN